jgi:hypothetical protein
MMFFVIKFFINTCCPRKKRDEDIIIPSRLPWLWVGAVYPDGKVEDHTEYINKHSNYGMKITTNLMNFALPKKSVVTWKYIDTETLEEKDFPSEGFVIDAKAN